MHDVDYVKRDNSRGENPGGVRHSSSLARIDLRQFAELIRANFVLLE